MDTPTFINLVDKLYQATEQSVLHLDGPYKNRFATLVEQQLVQLLNCSEAIATQLNSVLTKHNVKLLHALYCHLDNVAIIYRSLPKCAGEPPTDCVQLCLAIRDCTVTAIEKLTTALTDLDITIKDKSEDNEEYNRLDHPDTTSKRKKSSKNCDKCRSVSTTNPGIVTGF